jgi:hypothetical protein
MRLQTAHPIASDSMLLLAADRYASPAHFRRCATSGVKLQLISLGPWHNFGGVDAFGTFCAQNWVAGGTCMVR